MSQVYHSTGSKPHLRVYPHCGACNRPVGRKDTLVAIHFRLFQTFEGAIHKLPLFKKGELVKPGKNAVFCKDAGCYQCSTNRVGSATFHADCFHLFNKYCHAEDKYARLWAAARRMYPLRNNVCFNNLYDPIAFQQLNIVFELLGGEILPLNLTRDIWDGIPTSSDVARYCSVLQLATEMNSAPRVPSICPLEEVRFWARGQYHIVQKDMGCELRFVRATFDSRGVKKLERVETARLPISETEIYAILTVSQFTGMVADFRYHEWAT
ncbi:hypothetical protein A0O28_0014820 [Trichoderma guizhouense]|uniref:Uncharacterized protein n=1 Tax=Trichoderma guizhouense TaxID=1491466 RepID=A0A1T3CB92_9HYPO|nr:hypothetical protein A0O28_0014820 [Trichoderma guizhouense]